MRTTVNLPDSIMQRTKARAEEEKLTLGELIESALQDRLLRALHPPQEAPFRLVTFGGGGLAPGATVEGLKYQEEETEAQRWAAATDHGSSKANDAPP
jgi:hypothetical protein